MAVYFLRVDLATTFRWSHSLGLRDKARRALSRVAVEEGTIPASSNTLY